MGSTHGDAVARPYRWVTGSRRPPLRAELRGVTRTPAAQHGLAALRLSVATLAGGAVIAALLIVGAPWAVAVTAGWSTQALVFLAWIWLAIAGKDAEATEEHAQAEDVSRGTADAVLLAASVASLIAVGSTLVEAGQHSGSAKGLLTGLTVVSVFLAWATVHTLFTLRYGDLYYSDPVGGIDFNDKDAPDYRDIAYVAFTIGMTFQVSDTNLTTKTIRRAALRHALLSYLFGAVIIAVMINLAASLLNH